MYTGLHVKCPLFFPDFKETWIFPANYRQKNQISNFIKIPSAGAKLFQADRRTDKKKLIVVFRNSANTPQRVCVITCPCRILFCPVAEQPKSGLGRLVMRLISHTHPLGVLWKRDQLGAEAATYTTHNKRLTSKLSAGFEPLVPAFKRPQSCALDCTATGM